MSTLSSPPPPFDPNESQADTIIGVVAFVLTLATIALGFRIYTRAVLIKSFGVDDYLACFSWTLIFATCFCVAYNTRFGFGRHIYILEPETIMLYTRTFYVSVVFYNASLAAIKMTFLTMYYRILAVKRSHKLVCIGAMIFVGGWSLSQVLVEIFICTPIPAFWNKTIEGAFCIPNYPQWYINAAGNILTDIIVFVLPLPVIKKLKLERYQKFILMFIFCLGFFTVLISFIRLRFLTLNEDVTYDNIETAGWSVGELCSGLICACLTTLRPLMHKWFPGLSGKVEETVRRVSLEIPRVSMDPEKGRPTLSRNPTGKIVVAGGDEGESREGLHDNAAAPGQQADSHDDVRGSVVSDSTLGMPMQGNVSSEESLGMPIMRHDKLPTVESRIAEGKI